ncbi:hypothetical protein [Yersinia phage fHe-Yen9-04]|uniref:Phage protein n=2 Tax=Eneladusvirus Yen904 TaxID=2560849 RepID=A0A2C9CZQ3_9CAUD|nr:baseplate wedge subunit [Yersinia phage fHe-Yen9-04]SOK58512.1 hypothetical protein [Yersinia phage fHe-Yen9-04]SOK59047.1 hypothetical protein [Yersinia phage fHe-Yen9-03]VUE36281.1 hypothetical protein [Yersinia phage fHe-Yen9-04]
MASKYSQYSPYAKTTQTWYLEYNLPAPLYPADSDIEYTIPNQYDEQPWRLAKNLYGNERLYYVFALLNPNLLVDPIYDFKSGTTILIPTLQRVQNWLNGSRNIS